MPIKKSELRRMVREEIKKSSMKNGRKPCGACKKKRGPYSAT